MRVQYIGPFGQKTGYAQAAHDYMLALHRTGVDLDITPIIPLTLGSIELDERYNELLPLVRGGVEPTHVVVHAPPAYAKLALETHFKNGKNIPKVLITTWETSNMPGEIGAEIAATFDLVIVPSQFCADAMFGPLEGMIRVVEHTFDPNHWTPVARRPTELYTFYSILTWAERKNPIGLLKAYLAEFTSSDQVKLVLKTPGYSQEDIQSLVACLGYTDLAPVEIIVEHFDHEELCDFHQENDCFVIATRGEGWCLPAFEAALLGKPVIAPRWGGQTEFLEDYPNTHTFGGCLTPAISPPQMEEVVIGGVRMRQSKQIGPRGITARQRWFEPDLFALQRLMRSAYQRRFGENHTGREVLEGRFGYSRIGPRLLKMIGGLS